MIKGDFNGHVGKNGDWRLWMEESKGGFYPQLCCFQSCNSWIIKSSQESITQHRLLIPNILVKNITANIDD